MSTLPPLLIRTDATPAIGTGHGMRMLALAQGYGGRGGRVILAAAELPQWLHQRFEKHGILVQHVPKNPGTDDDALFTAQLAQQWGSPWVVLDGYHFDRHFHRAIRSAGRRLLVMDDLAHLDHYEADLVLNQNYGAERLVYKRAPHTRLLLGTRYILFRQEFRRAARQRHHRPRWGNRVLITFGGSDPARMSIKVLNALAGVHRPLNIAVAVGGSYGDPSSLQDVAARSPHNVSLHHNAVDMTPLMTRAHVAISAGGSTVWELLLMGLPSAIITVAPNQKGLVQELAAKGWVTFLGDAGALDEAQLARGLTRFLNDPRPVAGCPVDVKGVDRVIRAMQMGGTVNGQFTACG